MTKPLEGIRVADFSWFGAGPIAGKALADFGAEVIRVESEVHIDGLRIGQPVRPGQEGYNASGYFNNFNPGKKSFLLNMGKEGAREIALRLIEKCDIFLANYSARVTENWALSYDSLSQANPKIIAAYMPLQGLWGPHRDYAGFGSLLTAIAGFNHLSGYPNRPPFGVGTNYPDYTVNCGHAVISIISALRYREKTGKGQMIELAQVESTAATLGTALMDYAINGRNQTRAGNRVPHMSPHGAFRCPDEPRTHPPALGQAAGRERWVAIAVATDGDWAGMCSVAAGQPFAADPRFQTLLGRKQNEDDLEAAISAWTATQPAKELAARLQAAGCPAGLVQDAEDVLEHDEHMKARGYFQFLDHPETGISAYDGPIARLHGTPGATELPAPLFGEHTFDIAVETLGYDPDQVAEMVANGILS